MAHIKEVDENVGTVIGVQVENETGMQGSDREHSDFADEKFAEEVPAEFVSYMKAHTDSMEADVREAVENGAHAGNWEQVFGACAGEIFTAYYVASYVEKVAAAGQGSI